MSSFELLLPDRDWSQSAKGRLQPEVSGPGPNHEIWKGVKTGTQSGHFNLPSVFLVSGKSISQDNIKITGEYLS